MKKQLIKSIGLSSLFKLLFLSFALINLGACAVHKSSFDCSNGKGMGCGSMIDVHKSIKNNSFEQQESFGARKTVTMCKSCQKDNITNPSNLGSTNGENRTIYSIDKISRSQDKVMCVWFNSYFDEYNNFHDSQYIYTIIQPSQWLIKGQESS